MALSFAVALKTSLVAALFASCLLLEASSGSEAGERGVNVVGDAPLRIGDVGAPVSERRIIFRAVYAKGLFPKILTLRGRIEGEEGEREFARIDYGGLGQGFAETQWIVVADAADIYLEMDVDAMGAPSFVPPVMRSNDPETSHYLFYMVDGKWVQRPRGVKVDVFADTNCQISDQSWEDGGGFETQDFFFQVRSGMSCDAIAFDETERRPSHIK
jgi:hypothetical protein